MSENNAENSVETRTPEELAAALVKAEAKIVDLKKTSTTDTDKNDNNNEEEKNEKSPETFWKEEVEKLIAEAIKDKAIETQEETFKQNQDTTNSMSTWNEDSTTTAWFKALTVDQYTSMTPQAQREYIKLSTDKVWEVSFADET